ncbi:unnamed protein product [Mytilus edulis]|uniref:C-type lectin domain-containing protein n=1 Tax=Mytilus edulis TaxID=6550 RepID=A0A8S3R3T5_MYTED|nr:unnamed protein product [Mytilus edulis]
MSSANHSAKCKRTTVLNRNVQSDRENDDYDVIFPDGSDANWKKEEKANISEDRYDGHYQGLKKNRGEMIYDALQTLDKNTKDRRLVRLKVLAGFKPCHEGWVFKDKSFGCYYISNITLAWTDANEFCRNMSSCLTNILSSEDMNWLGNPTNEDMWVGGNQNGNVYQWECQQYNYQKQISSNSSLWARDEPRPDNTTRCVQIWKLEKGFGLDDHYCDISKRFLCKAVPIIR